MKDTYFSPEEWQKIMRIKLYNNGTSKNYKIVKKFTTE